MASSASQITAGDLDGDETDDLVGLWVKLITLVVLILTLKTYLILFEKCGWKKMEELGQIYQS